MVTLGTGMTQILAPSEGRVALLFTPPTTAGQVITLSTDGSAVFGQGLNLTMSSGILSITEELYGDTVRMPWYASASGAGIALGFIETLVG